MRYAKVTDVLVTPLIGFIEMRNSVGGVNHGAHLPWIVHVREVRHEAFLMGQCLKGFPSWVCPLAPNF